MIATRTKTYLSDVVVYDAAAIDQQSNADPGVISIIRQKSPVLVRDEGQPERLLLPVFNSRELLSVVSLQIGDPNEVVGVSEIWEPVGPHDEVKLTAGSFGTLERFQNVSSFVRFEIGNGLPGQVWQTSQGLIHDDLANHPGFLRAAGASAGSLQTALGIPVFSDRFIATVVLIGSLKAPIATACEVWERVDSEFELRSSAYQPHADLSRFDVGQKVAASSGLLGAVDHRSGAIVSTEQDVLMDGRGPGDGFALGLAIPSYVDGEVASVTQLLF